MAKTKNVIRAQESKPEHETNGALKPTKLAKLRGRIKEEGIEDAFDPDKQQDLIQGLKGVRSDVGSRIRKTLDLLGDNVDVNADREPTFAENVILGLSQLEVALLDFQTFIKKYRSLIK